MEAARPSFPEADKMKLLLQSFLLAITCALLTGCYQQIPPSSVGIKFTANNGISEKLVKPQLTYVGPMQKLIIYPTSIRNSSYVRNNAEGSRRGDESIRASTVEGATLPVDVTVAWHVDPANVVTAFESFGTSDLDEIQRVFIRSSTTFAVNVVAGQRSIFDLTSKERAQFGPDVKKVLEPMLAEFGITVDDVYIGEVFPSDEINNKVNERVAKRNELEKATIGLEQARIDAKTVLTNARKQAELNKQLAAQGDKAIELKRLENRRKAIEAWNGQPSQVGDGSIPFTNIKLQ
jgi:regulator of protease activity HflC (stomatin/prohibitin superfamily)